MSALLSASHDDYTLLCLPGVMGAQPLAWVRGRDEQLGAIYASKGSSYQYCDVCGGCCYLKIESVFLESSCWWCWRDGRNVFRNMLSGSVDWSDSALSAGLEF